VKKICGSIVGVPDGDTKLTPLKYNSEEFPIETTLKTSKRKHKRESTVAV
jgi:hypothetical protein